MARSPEMIGFIATIQKPDAVDAEHIFEGQKVEPRRIIECIFNAGEKDQRTATYTPYLHYKNGIDESGILEDIRNADFVQILDIESR
jgi:hypothetical protein